MEIVAITCMVIIIIVGTHLYNWGSRAMFKDEKGPDTLVLWVVMTILYVLIMIPVFEHLILWAYPLIK